LDVGNKCCFTGYRPSKFPFPLSQNSREYIEFENSLVKTILDLADCSVNEFYCGLAMGFDIIAGECVLLAKEIRPQQNIRLVCAVPFAAQSANYPPQWKERYDTLLRLADRAVLTSDNYHKSCYAIRNKFMVDASDTVVTWFDGKSGGTKNTIAYAISKNRKIINLYKAESKDLYKGIEYVDFNEMDIEDFEEEE